MLSLLKQNIKLAFPIFTGQLAFTFISFIDNIMIGRLGVTSLSAFSLSNHIIFLAFALNIGFTLMFTPLISEKYNVGSIRECKSIFFHGLVIYTIWGIILFIILKIVFSNLSNLGQSQEVVKTAKPYYSILLYSFVPAFLFQALKQFSDGLSKTKTAMYCILASVILNISLNYFLIFGKIGLPRLGLLGSAVGTLISRTFLFVLFLFCLLKNDDTKIFFQNLSSQKFKLGAAKQIISLGSYSSFQVFFKIALLTSSVIISGKLNATAQASNQIILSISSLMFAVPFSLGTASAIQSSKFLAQKNIFNFKKSIQSFFILSITSSVIFTIIIQIYKNIIPAFYIDDKSIIFTAANTFLFLSLFQVVDSLETIILGTLKGTKDTFKPFFITFTCYLIFAIPLSFILAKTSGITGLWLGLTAGVIGSLFFLLCRIKTVISNFKNLIISENKAIM